MLLGHAYARALRTHMLSVAALVSHMLDASNCLTGIDIDNYKYLYELLPDFDLNEPILSR